MRALAAALFQQHPELSFAALAPRENLARLNATPYGVQAELLPAETNGPLCDQYFRLNHHAFGKLPMPRWVFSDLYLLPGAIGLLLGPASRLNEAARPVVELAAGQSDRVILAAYVGAPSIEPGRFIGVSLMSLASGFGAGAWVKALTLQLLGAKRVRGVAQWENASVPVHARLGPLRIIGRIPGGHELADRSFVYECDVSDEAALARSMARKSGETPTLAVPLGEGATFARILDEAEAGKRWRIVAPAVDGQKRVLFVEG